MDHETLVDNLIEACESEPQGGYGDRGTDEYVRTQAIRARFLDLIEEYDDNRVPTDSDLAQADDEVVDLEARNDALLDEIEKLMQRVAELEEEATR